MNYEPKFGDVVRWTSIEIDGVVREIYDNNECLVHFKDGFVIRRISADSLTFISRPDPSPDPSPEPSIDVSKRSKTMNYEPKLGDVVRHSKCWKNGCECLGLDGVVVDINDGRYKVRFEDGAKRHMLADSLTFISRPDPSPEPSPDTKLRNKFAGLAMAAMVGNVWESFKFEKKGTPGAITQTTRHFPMDEIMLEGTDPDDNTGCYDRDISISAYRIADAMLAARGGK